MRCNKIADCSLENKAKQYLVDETKLQANICEEWDILTNILQYIVYPETLAVIKFDDLHKIRLYFNIGGN